MTVHQLAGFQKPETRSVVAQAKFTPSESVALDTFVEFCKQQGVPGATRSSAIRALVLNGLEAYREVSQEKEKTTG